MSLLGSLRNRIRNAHPDHHAIALGMAWVAAFSLAGKLVGAGKEMAVAWRYGVSAEVDAFLFLFNLVSWPVAVWFSVLSSVLVPLGSRARQEADAGLPRFRAELLGLVLVLGLGLAVAGWLGLPLVLQSPWIRLPPATAAIGLGMVPVLAWVAPLGLVVSLLSAWMLSAGRHANTLLESVPALAVLALLLLWGNGGAGPLVWGTVGGSLLQLVALALLLAWRGEADAPRFTWRSPHWAPFRRSFAVMLVGQAIMSATGVVDQLFAAGLGTGAIATLGYSNRILSLLLGLGAMAVLRATLPVFSRAQGQGLGEVERVATLWVRLLFGLGLVTTAVAWPLAPLGVRLLFQRGAFTGADAAAVTEVLRYGLLQLPPYFAGIVLVSLLASSGRHGVLALVAGGNLLVKLVAMALLTPHFGVRGLPLATSLMYASTLAMLLVAVRRRSG